MQPNSFTSFDGSRRLASGPLQTVALAVKRALEGGAAGPVLIFDDYNGRPIDIDTRGTDEEVLGRLPVQVSSEGPGGDEFGEGEESLPATGESRGRGRPKLGVVPREVTLLPRHWDWLAAQPGGASVALRKLVDEARRAHAERDRVRKAQERAYHFMLALAGDMPHFEEASRALFANDRPRFQELIAPWPADVRDHACWLAFGEQAAKG